MQHASAQRQALIRKAEMVGCELFPNRGTMTVVQFLSGGEPYLLGYRLSWEETNDLLNTLADEQGVEVPEWRALQDA